MTRADIRRQLAAFRKAGGKVDVIPQGVTGLDRSGHPHRRKKPKTQGRAIVFRKDRHELA